MNSTAVIVSTASKMKRRMKHICTVRKQALILISIHNQHGIDHNSLRIRLMPTSLVLNPMALFEMRARLEYVARNLPMIHTNWMAFQSLWSSV